MGGLYATAGYVAHALYIRDTLAGELVATAPIGKARRVIACSPGGGRLYVSGGSRTLSATSPWSN